MFAVESGILGFENRNTAQRSRNHDLTNDCNPDFGKFLLVESGIQQIFALENRNPGLWSSSNSEFY